MILNKSLFNDQFQDFGSIDGHLDRFNGPSIPIEKKILGRHHHEMLPSGSPTTDAYEVRLFSKLHFDYSFSFKETIKKIYLQRLGGDVLR